MKRCVIIAGSPEFVLTPLRNDDECEDYIIAVDKGYEYVCQANITPTLFVGDMDSCAVSVDESIPKLTAPKEKDDTDTLLAIKHALGLGFKHFLLLGCLGGRLDHMLANIACAAYIASQGGKAEVISVRDTIYAFQNTELVLEIQPDSYFSVFSYGDHAEGVSIENARYPLTNVVLTNLFPIGVSNEFIGKSVTVTVKKGILLVVLSKREPLTELPAMPS